MIARLGAKFRQISGGTVVPLAPPPIIGIGSGGGFTYVLEDLRGGDPKTTRAALDAIIRRLKERRIAVLLAGMLAPRNFGPDYAKEVVHRDDMVLL